MIYYVIYIFIRYYSIYPTVDGRNSAPPKTEVLLAPSISPFNIASHGAPSSARWCRISVNIDMGPRGLHTYDDSSGAGFLPSTESTVVRTTVLIVNYCFFASVQMARSVRSWKSWLEARFALDLALSSLSLRIS